MTFSLEICTPNIQSVQAAVLGKANRIELCSALEIGGLTPSAALVEMAAQQIETHVLIRPRAGDFLYNATDLHIIERDIEMAEQAGAKGVVIGMLDGSNMPHRQQIKHLLKHRTTLDYTFHRAFDFCPAPFDALEMLIDFGFTRILTSGTAPSAWEGRALIRQLHERADGRISIMPGAGITAENISRIQDKTGCTTFHSSAKKIVTSPSKTTLIGLDNDYMVSDAEIILGMKAALGMKE